MEVGHVNKVTRRSAGLVLRWVTVHRYTVFISDQPTQANSAWPSLCDWAKWVLVCGYGHCYGRIFEVLCNSTDTALLSPELLTFWPSRC